MAEDDTSTKRCAVCERRLPRDRFSSDRTKRDGLRTHCKECHRARRKPMPPDQRRAYRAANRERINAQKRAAWSKRERVPPAIEGEKRCIICCAVKPLTEFRVHARMPDGRSSSCCECSNRRDTARYWANRDAEIAKRRAYYVANCEAMKAAGRRWREANPERKRDKDRAWRVANREYKLARDRKWHAQNPERVRLYKRINQGKRRAATKDGSITAADVQRIGIAQRWRCAICATGIKRRFHLDHIQPLSRGGTHEPSNAQLLCPPCNLSKSDKDPLDFSRERGLLI